MNKLAPRPLTSSSLLVLGLLLSLNLGGMKTASAQDLDNVTITGKVVDQNGAVIPGASVEAILVKTGAARKVVADAEGRYHIIQLEPGVYNLRSSFAGFALQEKPELTLV
ncbi:MAG TPA: carboxypeptidase-like regulatory domain-containing protein, partial [Pyrinomonadaceae bacterium]|nr:carboxypeptidase-like regulatory domain-containing protein [Pyrinomonadaceae bacterium]